jgi:hypothetical protein
MAKITSVEAGYLRNDSGHPPLSLEIFKPMADLMNTLPVDRALRIYGVLANRAEAKDARDKLSKYLMKMYIEGERDEHRLTVNGLSYLQKLDRERDSRN